MIMFQAIHSPTPKAARLIREGGHKGLKGSSFMIAKLIYIKLYDIS